MKAQAIAIARTNHFAIVDWKDWVRFGHSVFDGDREYVATRDDRGPSPPGLMARDSMLSAAFHVWEAEVGRRAPRWRAPILAIARVVDMQSPSNSKTIWPYRHLANARPILVMGDLLSLP